MKNLSQNNEFSHYHQTLFLYSRNYLLFKKSLALLTILPEICGFPLIIYELNAVLNIY